MLSLSSKPLLDFGNAILSLTQRVSEEDIPNILTYSNTQVTGGTRTCAAVTDSDESHFGISVTESS